MNDTFTCPLCGKPHRLSAKFCPSTGKLIPSVSQPGPTPHPQPSIPKEIGMTGRLPPNVVINNRFMILKKIGAGGMAAVYQAADTRLPGKVWAVKEMSESWITDKLERAQAVQAFRQEALLLAKLSHANLPRVIDTFSEGGRHYLVMEYVQGNTLEKILEERSTPFTEAEVLPWALQLCDVLHYLHNQPQPIIFRDLKPSNIMIDQSGQVKLIDFGIVRFFKQGQAKDTMAIGTQGYCAVEAISGQTDARSDLYSLCVVLHEMLTKHDPTTTLFRLPSICNINSRVSQEWERILQRGLESDRNLRWPDTKSLGDALSRAREGQSTVGVKAPQFTPIAGYEEGIQVEKTPPKRTSRPTVRLVAAAAQLSSWQLMAAIGITAVLVIAGLWILTPILVQYPLIWNNIPIVSLVAPFVYAAVPRRWVASIAHAVLAIAGGLTISMRINVVDNYLVGLFLGALLSAGFIEIWLRYLDKIRGPLGEEAWKRELAWYCGMAVIATALLYEFTFRGGLNPVLWIGAVFMAAVGWFLGDMVKEYLKIRQIG